MKVGNIFIFRCVKVLNKNDLLGKLLHFWHLKKFYYILNLQLQFLRALVLVFQDRPHFYLKRRADDDHLFHGFHSARFGFYAHVLYRFASDGGANTCSLKAFYYVSSIIYTYIHAYVCVHVYIHICIYLWYACVYIHTYVYICYMHVCVYKYRRGTHTQHSWSAKSEIIHRDDGTQSSGMQRPSDGSVSSIRSMHGSWGEGGEETLPVGLLVLWPTYG